MTVDLSCITLNVRRLNNMRKRRQICRWLHGRKFQVIVLQEVYSSKDLEKLWSAEWGGKIVYCHGTNHSSGTLIMFNPSLDVEWKIGWLSRKVDKLFCVQESIYYFIFYKYIRSKRPQKTIGIFRNLKNKRRKVCWRKRHYRWWLELLFSARTQERWAPHWAKETINRFHH